jgi:hypothetical protein
MSQKSRRCLANPYGAVSFSEGAFQIIFLADYVAHMKRAKLEMRIGFLCRGA